MKDKKFIDILPKFTNWEDISYAPGLNCPHCEKSGFVDDIEKPNLVGWCDTPQGYMIVFECPHCFEKFRFHGNIDNIYDIEKFDWYLGTNYVEMSANKDEILSKWEKYWKGEYIMETKLTCPKCGSKNIICHPGMFVDRYECKDCNHEWR